MCVCVCVYCVVMLRSHHHYVLQVTTSYNKLPLYLPNQKVHTPPFIDPLNIPLDKLTCNT